MKKFKLNQRNNDNIKVGNYDYQNLAHWYFYNYGSKSTANDRLSCNGDSIYSYSTKIGELHQNKASDVLFLLSEENHSPTTAKQKNIVKRACPYRAIEVDKVDAYTKSHHSRNVELIYNQLLELSLKATRARVNYEFYTEEVYRKIRDLKDYAYFFKLGMLSEIRIVKKFDNAEDFIKSVVPKYKSEKVAENKKRKAELKKRKAEDKRLAELAHNLWVEGITSSLIYDSVTDRNYSMYTLLRSHKSIFKFDSIRFINDRFNTSQGININKKPGLSLFKLWESGKLRVGYDIQGFEVILVSPERITIGCHVLDFEQCKKIIIGVENDG